MVTRFWSIRRCCLLKSWQTTNEFGEMSSWRELTHWLCDTVTNKRKVSQPHFLRRSTRSCKPIAVRFEIGRKLESFH